MKMKHSTVSRIMLGAVFCWLLAACSPAATSTQEAMLTTPTIAAAQAEAMAKPTKDVMMKPTAVMAGSTPDAMVEPTGEAMAQPTEQATMMITGRAWLDTPLTDVTTGQSFKLSDFKGQIVLVEGIAAWCTNCLRQQRELAQLHQQIGDQAQSVAIDIDLNEDAELLKKHAETNGFDWRYAVATPDLAQALADEFGSHFLNPPSVPMFLLDKEGSVHLLDFGHKPVDYLTQQIQSYQ
jgi:thiol-disulfide isomerase/thioredoxin